MFLRPLILFCITITFPAKYLASTTITGSLELDDLTFDKVINKFETAVVKFDVAYPFGEQHDAFVKLAKEYIGIEELLLGEVGVKDYGDKDNEILAARYGLTKDDYPVVKLFTKGVPEPITYTEKKITVESLRRFIADNSKVYLSLPGCIKELDELAAKFVKSDKEARKNIIKETENILEKIDEKHSTNGKSYLIIMEKILEKGDDFIQKETERITKLLDSKVSKEKKNALSIKINILRSFKQGVNKKDEL